METVKGPVVAKGFIFSKEAKGVIFMKNEVEKKKALNVETLQKSERETYIH